MTKPITRRYLESYKHWAKRAEETYTEWEGLMRKKDSLSVNYDDMPKASNKQGFDQVVELIDTVAERYWNEYVTALRIQDDIEKFIGTLENPKHMRIFEEKYIRGDQTHVQYSHVVGDEIGYHRVEIENIITRVINEHNKKLATHDYTIMC